MKVAITNGWLVFDNEIPGNVEDHYPYKCRRGRLRLDSVSSYAATKECGSDPVTLVHVAGQEDAWRLDGNHQELLDGYFGRSA